MDELARLELSQNAKKNKNKIQSKLVSCYDCQSYDGGEITWIYGEKWELAELFADNKIPENQWEAIANNLHCPNCGISEFETYIDVGIKSKFDIALDKYIDQTLKKYTPLIQEFDTLIEKTPLLAFSHKFGRKIYNELKKSEFPVTAIKGVFYRAREVKNSEVLSKEKMMNPPLGKPQEGRYNHSGQSHLYLSNNRDTAIEEVVMGNGDKVVWTIEINVQKINKILDLSFDWMQTTPDTSPVYFALCGQNIINKSDRNTDLWKPDYFITRFIMDSAKMLGYNGIKYNSSKVRYIENVVLFYPEKCVMEAIDEPELCVYKKKEVRKRVIIDL